MADCRARSFGKPTVQNALVHRTRLHPFRRCMRCQEELALQRAKQLSHGPLNSVHPQGAGSVTQMAEIDMADASASQTRSRRRPGFSCRKGKLRDGTDAVRRRRGSALAFADSQQTWGSWRAERSAELTDTWSGWMRRATAGLRIPTSSTCERGGGREPTAGLSSRHPRIAAFSARFVDISGKVWYLRRL